MQQTSCMVLVAVKWCIWSHPPNSRSPKWPLNAETDRVLKGVKLAATSSDKIPHIWQQLRRRDRSQCCKQLLTLSHGCMQKQISPLVYDILPKMSNTLLSGNYRLISGADSWYVFEEMTPTSSRESERESGIRPFISRP